MQLVIDIPGEIRKAIYDGVYCGISDERVYDAIKNGVALPERHRRLIDADALIEKAPEIQEYLDVLAPTIIEADEDESEGMVGNI